MTLQHTVFVAVFAASVLSFMYSCYQRLQLIGMGASDNRFDAPVGRVFGMLNYAFGQKRVVARPYGLNHFLLFWAFLLLLLANDREIMGDLANGRLANLAGGAIIIAIAIIVVVLVRRRRRRRRRRQGR